MSVQPIRLFGDPILKTPALEVTTFDKELRTLVKDLTSTMLDAGGAGLAAPQIGVSLRVFTYDVDDVVGHLINPVLTLSPETQDGPEGCLSIPGLAFDCVRAEHVIAHGFNMFGEPVILEGSDLLARCIQHETDHLDGSDLLARCIQHETDHLDGIVFVDRLDDETRKLAMKAIRETEWFGQEPQIKLSPHPLGNGLF